MLPMESVTTEEEHKTMVEPSGDRMSPSKAVCRYYMMSNCLKGDRCRFAHRLPSPSMQDNLFPHKQDNLLMEFHESHQASKSSLSDVDSNLSLDQCRYGDVDHLYSPGSCDPYDCSPIAAGNFTFADETSSEAARQEDPRKSFGQSLAVGRAESASESLLAAALKPEDWVMAAEFVPGQMWQSRSLSKSADSEMALKSDGHSGRVFNDLPLDGCPEMSAGCIYPNQGMCAEMLSGEVCELCGNVILTTLSEDDRQKHITECIEQHEKEMERSFAIQRSQEKVCGVCMDVVWEKSVISEQRFGILPNCNHVFCLACIRKWRSAKQFENKIVRACPECRVKSDYVTPSRYWVEDKEDKKKLIEEYKLALSKKPCKYFDKGRGDCPFNEKCFYLHALPDGRVASPRPAYRRRRPPTTSSSQTEGSASRMVLYEILEGWPLDRWEDLIFHLNFFELSLPSTSDEEDDDREDDFDDSDLSSIM